LVEICQTANSANSFWVVSQQLGVGCADAALNWAAFLFYGKIKKGVLRK